MDLFSSILLSSDYTICRSSNLDRAEYIKLSTIKAVFSLKPIVKKRLNFIVLQEIFTDSDYETTDSIYFSIVGVQNPSEYVVIDDHGGLVQTKTIETVIGNIVKYNDLNIYRFDSHMNVYAEKYEAFWINTENLATVEVIKSDRQLIREGEDLVFTFKDGETLRVTDQYFTNTGGTLKVMNECYKMIWGNSDG